jgi:hypothetical protein
MRRITHYEQRLRTLHYKKKFTIWLAEIRPKVRVPAKIYCRLFQKKIMKTSNSFARKSYFSLFPGGIVGCFCPDLHCVLAKIYFF